MSSKLNLGRRALLAAPAGLLCGLGPGDGLRLLPGADRLARVETEAGAGDVFRLWIEGRGDPVEVPALRARRLANLPIAGRELLALAFGADIAGESSQDLVALAGWDGAQVRILALETLAWRRDDGAAFTMRVMATPDRDHLSLNCFASMARPVTRPFHRVWADLLQWRDGAPLADALPRPPLAGSWQEAMGGLRRQVTSFLAEPRAALTPDDVAASGILQQFGCMADR